mmetsp:Transcript_7650/g.24516  ORF Transcript_7650/g.24516 Transcript_7650/m.24516 type:complete len:203 (+) Transcript_7650:434-1042(+)
MRAAIFTLLSMPACLTTTRRSESKKKRSRRPVSRERKSSSRTRMRRGPRFAAPRLRLGARSRGRLAMARSMSCSLDRCSSSKPRRLTSSAASPNAANALSNAAIWSGRSTDALDSSRVSRRYRGTRCTGMMSKSVKSRLGRVLSDRKRRKRSSRPATRLLVRRSSASAPAKTATKSAKGSAHDRARSSNGRPSNAPFFSATL